MQPTNLSVRVIKVSEVTIKPDRQRGDARPEEHILSLRKSICEIGLLHAITVSPDLSLVAGECRLHAVAGITVPYNYGDTAIPPGSIVAVVLDTEDEETLQRIELEENVRRKNLTPAQEASAIARLHRFRTIEAEGEWTKLQTAQELAAIRNTDSSSASIVEVADSILIDEMKDDPDVQKATSRTQAVKIARRKMEQLLSESLVNLVPNSSMDMELIEGDCQNAMSTMMPNSISGIIVDPPYGMGADRFGDQTFSGGHQYEDDIESAFDVIEDIAAQGQIITKPNAHMYIFCDIRYWEHIKVICEQHHWRVYATPLIWHKPNLGHAPQPGYFLRRYEVILFAYKGDRTLSISSSDVMTFNAVMTKDHAAQKPVELYQHLMKLSFLPGETVYDPCAGSGTVFRAARACGLRAIGSENNAHSIVLCKKTIQELG